MAWPVRRARRAAPARSATHSASHRTRRPSSPAPGPAPAGCSPARPGRPAARSAAAPPGPAATGPPPQGASRSSSPTVAGIRAARDGRTVTLDPVLRPDHLRQQRQVLPTAGLQPANLRRERGEPGVVHTLPVPERVQQVLSGLGEHLVPARPVLLLLVAQQRGGFVEVPQVRCDRRRRRRPRRRTGAP